MFREVFKTLKEYEIVENNSQRLNKGYNEKYTFKKIYDNIYGSDYDEY